ncbi:MAG: TlpA family protein disulfide reductase [Deferribacteres bacterium]|nr:TlpA family protein disulfide reductase [candidate division KSB1 bacterium]MCB9509267.1 TlpA family protein disulfide reductase [Deferribacteres bacterium]
MKARLSRIARMNRLMLYACFTTLLVFAANAEGRTQPLHIALPERTALDEHGFHISPLYKQPKEQLQLPARESETPVFLEIYYSRDIDDDATISIMVLQNEAGDSLYIDFNNNEDLRDDGPAAFFSLKESAFFFDIVAQLDRKQVTRIELRRKPIFADSAQGDSVFFDSAGNLKAGFAAMYSSMRSMDLKGKARTFFVDYRLGLHRGYAEIDDQPYAVGLFDYNNNGRFDDAEGKGNDVFLIDLDQDSRLTLENPYEVFALNDILAIGQKHYRIAFVDPYGAFVELAQTEEQTTARFLDHVQNAQAESAPSLGMTIDPSLWNVPFQTLIGESISLTEFKGQFILLNFWGEWCKPCIAEIPELVYADEHFSENLAIISFLKTAQIEMARKTIEKFEMKWAQVLLTEEYEKAFRFRSYPTNILISPEGKILFSTISINRKMLEKWIH